MREKYSESERRKERERESDKRERKRYKTKKRENRLIFLIETQLEKAKLNYKLKNCI